MKNGLWLSITEYSDYRKISVSTIRRYIKSKQVEFKLVSGKYFIYVDKENYDNRLKKNKPNLEILELKQQVETLTKKLQVLEEQKCDLEMLVNLYEKKPPHTHEAKGEQPSYSH